MAIPRTAIFAAFLSVFAFGALGADRLIVRGDAFAVSNETATTEADNFFSMFGSRGLDKVGAGLYTLPRGLVYSPDSLPVRALEGSVTITDAGTLPSAEKPTDLLNLATFWLDASANIATNESGEITAWYDCRELKNGDAWSNLYCRAITFLNPKDSSGNVYSPVMPRATTPDGMSQKMINFGGYQTGTCMAFYNTNSVITMAFSSIHHIYMVLNLQNAYGFPFGAYNKVIVHPTNYGYVNINSYYNSADSDPQAMAGEFLVNGARLNPISTLVKKGLQLIEIHALADIPMASFMRLFGDRSISGRYGGDFIGEVLVFDGTKAQLTGTERLQVSRYLMDKWGITPTEGKTTVSLGEEASVQTIDGDITVAGRGIIERSGTESAHFSPTASNPMAGHKVHLASGTMKADVREINLAVKSGEALSFAMDKYGVHTVTAGAAAAGEASIGGASECVRLGHIDALVTNLTVNAKCVVLGDTVVGGDRLQTGLGSATVANGSFESGFSASDWVWDQKDGSSSIKTFKSESDTLDWRIAGDGTNRDTFKNTYRLSQFMPTDGTNSLLLKVANVFHGRINVMRDGDYILSFDGSGRYKYDNMQLTLSLVDENEKTNTFACCTLSMGTGYHPYRYLLSGLKTGSYKLVIRCENGKAVAASADSHAMLDNFRMSPVSDGLSAVGGVAMPNGSFEATRITSNTRVVTEMGTNGLSCAGWTLSAPDATAANAVVPVSRLMVNHYLPAENDIGTWQLRFHGNTGRATSAAFSLPAGRWVLRCKAAKYAFDTVIWNDEKGRHNNPVLAVKAMVNGSQVFDTHSSAISKYEMQQISFKDELIVSETDKIVLELRQATSKAMANVDDLEFVPAGTWGLSPELVKDGTFDNTDSKGAFLNWRSNGKGSYWVKVLNGELEEHYGGQRCDGQNAVCIKNNAGLLQDVTFPAAGTYRLSFWARSRVAYYSSDKWGNPSTTDFGGNQLRASLIVGGVTNTIVETPSLVSTNFNQTVALFTVPTAGTHTFCIAGINDPKSGIWTGGSKDDSNLMLDLVSITAAPSDGAAPSLSQDLSLTLAKGSQLRLDYSGEATIHKLKIGSKRYHGRVDSSIAPDVVTGPGVLNVTEPRPGMAIIIR